MCEYRPETAEQLAEQIMCGKAPPAEQLAEYRRQLANNPPPAPEHGEYRHFVPDGFHVVEDADGERLVPNSGEWPRLFNPDGNLLPTAYGISYKMAPPPGAELEAKRAAAAKSFAGIEASHAANPPSSEPVTAQRGMRLTVAELRELFGPEPVTWRTLPVWGYVAYLALFVACLALGGVVGLSLWKG